MKTYPLKDYVILTSAVLGPGREFGEKMWEIFAEAFPHLKDVRVDGSGKPVGDEHGKEN